MPDRFGPHEDRGEHQKLIEAADEYRRRRFRWESAAAYPAVIRADRKLRLDRSRKTFLQELHRVGATKVAELLEAEDKED